MRQKQVQPFNESLNKWLYTFKFTANHSQNGTCFSNLVLPSDVTPLLIFPLIVEITLIESESIIQKISILHFITFVNPIPLHKHLVNRIFHSVNDTK